VAGASRLELIVGADYARNGLALQILQVLDLYAVDDIEHQTVQGKWGIREPDPALCGTPVQPSMISVALVPGLGFTEDGGRFVNTSLPIDLQRVVVLGGMRVSGTMWALLQAWLRWRVLRQASSRAEPGM
jgi:hypothetical protein